MDDQIDLYRQARLAQKRAEDGGLAGTATALAAIAEMIALETGVSAEVMMAFGPPRAAPADGAFPIFRQARP